MSLQQKAWRGSVLVLLVQSLTLLIFEAFFSTPVDETATRWLRLASEIILLGTPLLFLYYWFFSQQLLQPLEQLTRGIQHLDLGADRWNRLYLQTNDGEVARVSQAINQLLDRLAYYRSTMVDEGLRYKALLEQSSESILTVEPLSGRVVQANPSFASFIGRETVIDAPLWELFQTPREVLEQHAQTILKKGSLVLPSVTLRLWDGSWRNVEIRCSLIVYEGQELILISLSDMTEYQLLQEELQADLARAEQLQRNFVPQDLDNDLLQIRCIFHSCTGISGDFYDYFWDPRERRLKGFLVDVCGHGIATGMQASLTAAFLWYAVHLPGSLSQKLRWVNDKALRYYPEDSFATVFYFEVDLLTKKLHCVTGGVNYFLAYCNTEAKTIEIASSLVGVDNKPLFKQQSFELQGGDCFYFTTDGLFAEFPHCRELGLDRFSDVVRHLRKAAQNPVCRDDASAICLRIGLPRNGKRSSVLNRLLDITFTNFADFEQAHEEISDCLRNALNLTTNSLFEIAVHEAVNNALDNGNNCFGTLAVRLTCYLLHSTTLVVEVRDNGPGFAAQSQLRQLERLGPDAFDDSPLADGGRGIGIMLLAADSLSYNRRGTRVRLLKDIVRSDGNSDVRR